MEMGEKEKTERFKTLKKISCIPSIHLCQVICNQYD